MAELYQTADTWMTCSDEDALLLKTKVAELVKRPIDTIQISCASEWALKTYIDIYVFVTPDRTNPIAHLAIDKQGHFRNASDEDSL
jgi:hypothetical protein